MTTPTLTSLDDRLERVEIQLGIEHVALGSLDPLTPTTATGWAEDADKPTINVEFELNGTIVGKVAANLARADGHKGFSFALPAGASGTLAAYAIDSDGRRRVLQNSPQAVPAPLPAPSATPFTLLRTGATFADFASAHAAAQDGDTITVNPQTFNVSPDGFSIYKGVTVKSAVPGQRYSIVVAPNAAGAIGSGIGITPLYRVQKLGLSTRFTVTLLDGDISATQLTYATGKCAIFADFASGTAPCDLFIDNMKARNYDQAVESGNEYDWNDRTSTVTIGASCDFEQTGDIAGGDNNHCIYIGQIGGLSMVGSVVKDVRGVNWADPVYVSGSISSPPYWPVGMVVKTRAKATTIDGCDLTGSANSNLVESGNGGDLLIQNCKLNQGQWSDGNALISYGRFITATESKDPTRLVANDGRVNRLRVLNNTLVNNCTSKPMQWVELSNTCTQAGAPVVTYQIGGNTFTDNSAGLAIDPTKGYPGLTASQVFGIPLVVDGTTQTVVKAAQQQPPVTQPLVTQPPVVTPPTRTAPPWYATMTPNAWQPLPPPFTSFYSQVQKVAADRANPDDFSTYKIGYPFTGSNSAGYVTGDANTAPHTFPIPGQAQIAGVDPIPGYVDLRGDQGAIPAHDFTVVRRGVKYEGDFMFWMHQSGHGVGVWNQIVGIHWDTGLWLDITQQTIPPRGCATATDPAWGVDGRGISGHGYNGGVSLNPDNLLLITDGPAQVTGPGQPVIYAHNPAGDGWAGPNPVSDPSLGKDFFTVSPGDSASPNGRNCCQIIDSVRRELWNSFPNSDYRNSVLIARVDVKQGSTWQWVEVQPGNGTPAVGKASTVGFALEGEQWLVWFSEVNPDHCVIMGRDWINANGRRSSWNVSFVPKDGDPNNVIPKFVTDPAQVPNIDSTLGVQGIPATVVHGYDERTFYVIVYCLDSTTVLGDVYRVTPPPFDPSGVDGSASTFVQGLGTANPVVVPWVSEKLTQDPSSRFQLPTRGNQNGPWYPAHKTFQYLAAPKKGIAAMHDPGQVPQFFRLA